VVQPVVTPTARPAPTASVVDLKTFHTELSFATYEAEETVQLQLGQLAGVASVSVTQLDITVQYDPKRLSEDDIVRTLRNNPEVKMKDR